METTERNNTTTPVTAYRDSAKKSRHKNNTLRAIDAYECWLDLSDHCPSQPTSDDKEIPHADSRSSSLSSTATILQRWSCDGSASSKGGAPVSILRGKGHLRPRADESQ